MNINHLITIIKKKLYEKIDLEDILIEDKTFLHKSHKEFTEGKYHIKISIKSKELKSMNKIESNKKILKILDDELKTVIHSIQIFIT